VTAEPSLDVVVVSYRCRALLRNCLRSLEMHPARLRMSIYVVDNASGDGTVEMLAEEFPDVEAIALSSNAGFSVANNIGIRRGAGRYVLVLNPDTRVTAGALDHMLELMEERRDVGISGCRLELNDGSFDHAAKRSFPTIVGALGHFTGIGRRDRASNRLAQYRAPEVEHGEVDAVNGAFMLLRRSALEEVGLFDEGFWMYMEDLDLCFRFARAGWKTWYESSVTIVHVKAATSGTNRKPRLNYAFHYSMYRFYRKHYAEQRSAAFNSLVYAGIALKLALSVIRGSFRRHLLDRRLAQ
jgi:N-acetylglucosaminyl-diphospho-decaprenol L-rhamnosyltransferase